MPREKIRESFAQGYALLGDFISDEKNFDQIDNIVKSIIGESVDSLVLQGIDYVEENGENCIFILFFELLDIYPDTSYQLSSQTKSFDFSFSISF